MNFNPKTGIAYGYISANSLDPEWVDTLMYSNFAVDLSYKEAENEHIQVRESEWLEDHDDLEDFDYGDEEAAFSESYEGYEPTITGTLEGVQYQSSWLGGALHFFIFESPHVDTFQVCSPCVPGAADLDSPSKSGIEGYDVPSDWRYPDRGMPQT